MPYSPLKSTDKQWRNMIEERLRALEAKRVIQNGAITFVDNNNVVRAVLGLQPDGVTYGLGVLPYGGSTLQQVGGVLFGALVTATGVSNLAFANFTPTGSVTAYIGASGQALIGVAGGISTANAGSVNQQGICGVSVDGGAPVAQSTLVVSQGGNDGVNVAASVWYVQSGLTPGTTHTFQPQYKTANNGAATVNFSDVQVTVQPL